MYVRMYIRTCMHKYSCNVRIVTHSMREHTHAHALMCACAHTLDDVYSQVCTHHVLASVFAVCGACSPPVRSTGQIWFHCRSQPWKPATVCGSSNRCCSTNVLALTSYNIRITTWYDWIQFNTQVFLGNPSNAEASGHRMASCHIANKSSLYIYAQWMYENPWTMCPSIIGPRPGSVDGNS